jgi:hypothetical protein
MTGKPTAVETIAKAAPRLFIGACALALLLGSGTRAHAQINFVFLPDTQTAAPAALATYAATVSNTGASAVFLNGDNITFDGPATPDDTLFLSNFTGKLGAGQSITNQNIFTLTVDSNAMPGSYLGTFDILGGNTNTANNVLASQNFQLIVSSAVPETSTLLMLMLGVGGLVGVRRAGRKMRA